MKLTNIDNNKILKEISKLNSKKVLSRPFVNDHDKFLYYNALKKFIKLIGFSYLTEDLVFFKKSESIFYILSLFPEIEINIPSSITYDDFKNSKTLEPKSIDLIKKVIDIKMSHNQEVLDGPISKKVKISFQLMGFEYKVAKNYQNYSELNMLICANLAPKMIESLVYEQVFDHFRISHNLKNDELSKSLGVTIPDLIKQWELSDNSFTDHIFVDPTFSQSQSIQNLIKLIK